MYIVEIDRIRVKEFGNRMFDVVRSYVVSDIFYSVLDALPVPLNYGPIIDSWRRAFNDQPGVET